MNEWLLKNLVCPRDRSTLTLRDDMLTCCEGHRFPIVNEIPVMLLSNVDHTLWVAGASLKAANDWAENREQDPFLTDTLGLTETQRLQVRSRVAEVDSAPVDPVANALVGATNGYLYKEVCGQMNTYPIPELRLPDGTGTLLDIGCNWGRWSVAAARKGYSVVGIDPSLGAVLAAQRIAKRMGLESCFVVADARYLPFASASFDVIFSYSVIQHFSKPHAKEALLEFSRTLKPLGYSFIQMPNTYGIRSIYHQLKRRFRETTDFGVRYWTPKELVSTFAEIIGPTELSVDGYFGLGIQPSDAAMLPIQHRVVIYSSEWLRCIAGFFPPLMRLADSLYVKSTKSTEQTRSGPPADLSAPKVYSSSSSN